MTLTSAQVRPYLDMLDRSEGEGVFGFLDAFNRYDPKFGCAFRDYLYTRVKQAVVDERRSNGGLGGVAHPRRYGHRYSGGSDRLDEIPTDHRSMVEVRDELEAIRKRIPTAAWNFLWEWFVVYDGQASLMARAKGKSRFAIGMQKMWALRLARKMLEN